MVPLLTTLTAALLATGAVAHPGGHMNRDVLRRQAHLDHPERRSVEHCKKDLVASGWVREQHMRREARLHELRVAAGFAKPHELVRRDPAEVEENYGAEAACTLDPEVTEGPYYVAGELIRKDLLTGEKGAITHFDLNIIDTSTCKPITDAYVEIWGSNATGVYTGVQARGNGDGSNSAVFTNALRGVQPTAANGTASFITIIPGHYVGRANHIHTIIHHGAKLLPNNTISGGTVSHMGQFYIEQNFLGQVEKTSPYNTNKQKQTLNNQDILLNMGKQGGDDPFMKVSLIGSKIEDGLYAYVDVGVNPKATRKPDPVNFWTDKGGIPVPGSGWAGYPDTCRNCGFGGGRPPTVKGREAEAEAEIEVQDLDAE
ncbi:protocatechuate dioxygenase [Aaosphaeria arxii CBS 175.79]|uniref:Protocatechuate dioxygenase n=1 Tax=Aaosphaeria arxii CBS 175.79 TaxID=1450172 RepID=A0A6A5XC54_9PLEO|nr:protocatechuate dioxygenase [Aaosphaeria arxii CBS 175.79]KAF2010500.1 protocatechuate dioxygenase [Aaosphaeria arxii CBS 175.79]